MKKIRLIAAISLLLLAFEQKASAQFYFFDNNYYDTHLLFEAGGSVGAMNCLSDIGGRRGLGAPFLKDLNIGNTHLNGGFYLSAIYKYAVALRLEGTYGRVSAYDSILKDVEKTTNGRYQRNLNFRSNITEVSLVAEFHIRFILRSFLFEDDLNVDDEPPRLSPYIAAGIGFFSFNPQGKVGNNWVDLQPLSLEGQGFAEYPTRKPYKLTQMNIPIGVGMKYELTPFINLRAELLYRYLSTDYLDDVSVRYINRNVFQKYFSGTQLQNALDLSSNDRVNPGGPTGVYRKTEGGIRGDPTDNDAYFTLNFKAGFVFGREKIVRNRSPRRF
ncbi:MAG: hypothetical protein JWP81_144 [Ferruginibacter sp.]|nr:hypothetical protein [Ferruginibacter sp.]